VFISEENIRVIAREKQKDQLGGGAITDAETRAKNASGIDPLERAYFFHFFLQKFSTSPLALCRNTKRSVHRLRWSVCVHAGMDIQFGHCSQRTYSLAAAAAVSYAILCRRFSFFRFSRNAIWQLLVLLSLSLSLSLPLSLSLSLARSLAFSPAVNGEPDLLNSFIATAVSNFARKEEAEEQL
jgi:hypothetical protein